MLGLLNPNSSDFQSCVALSLIVYVGHGIVRRVALLFSPKISFGVGCRAPQVTTLRKYMVHLYLKLAGVGTPLSLVSIVR